MKKLFKLVREDLKIHSQNSYISFLLNLCFNISFRLILNYRIGNYLAKRRSPVNNLLILWLKKRQLTKFNSDISYDSKIGSRIRIPHPIGIIIGLGVEIDDDVMIWQQVTLGSHGNKSVKMDYPKIKSGVQLFSGCQVIGNITIHEGAKVAAGSIVLQDIPKNCLAAGIPAKVKKPRS